MALSQRWIAFGILGGVLLLHGPVCAQDPCGYEVAAIIKGPWCGDLLGFPPTTPTARDDSGAVAGFYSHCLFGPDEAFVWTSDGGLVTLDRPTGFTDALAWGLEGTTVVGTLMMNNLRNAVLWEAGVPIQLGTLPGGNFSEALAIANGVIIGNWGNNISGPGTRAFVWEDGEMIDLDLPMGPCTNASDINAHGVITGWMGEAFFIGSHAYLWEDGVVLDLGVIPGGFTSWGRALNDLDPPQVVGLGRIPQKGSQSAVWRAFLWNAGQMQDLGTLEGFLQSLALDVNDATEVVGAAFSSGQAAFIWRNGRMQDLNDLLLGESGLVHISSAFAINNRGEIICEATDMKGDGVAVLLVPATLTFADLTCDGQVQLDDFVALLDAWGPCNPGPCLADLDDDGRVGIVDLLLLLANWG